MKTKYQILLLLVLTGFSSCKKWLDVKPVTQIESDANFKDEQGFKDALTGVYVNMTKPALYGQELSYGFVDVLGKNYTQFTTYQPYAKDSKYTYDAAETKARIDNIWNGSYNTIANINNLIENLEKADRGLFSETNYQVIKGEAYGLRAFNHFDLLRLFAPSPASAGWDAPAIPYRDKFQTGTVPQSTVRQTLERIIADLQTASALLKDSDPIVKGSKVPSTTTGYLRDRAYKFNYYAVRALLARVYLYNGDKVNALACAKEIIDSGVFPPTDINQMIYSDKIMSTEVIFNLNINTLTTQWASNFSPNTGMYLSDSEWNDVYEVDNGGSADYRYQYQNQLFEGFYRISVKLRPEDNTAASNRLPLIRISEMYYIAAECLKTDDKPKSLAYLNTVRADRGLLDLDGSLSADQIQDEIFKEYRKEFFCEGQLFYYYKRINKSKIEFASIVAGNSVYVLPKPDNEIEYGSIK